MLKQVVADSDGYGEIAISQDGKYLATTMWSKDAIFIYGIEDGASLTPKKLAVCTDVFEPQGICFVADSNNILNCNGPAALPCITEFTVKGQHVRTMSSHSLGSGIIHREDLFFVSACNLESRFFSGVVVHDYATGAQLRIIGSYGPADGQLNNPSGLTLTRDGHVLVCDSDNHRVSKFNADTGAFVGHVFTSPSGEEYPMAVIQWEDGSYFVLSSPDIRMNDPVSLYAVQSSGGRILNRVVLAQFDEPASMAYCTQTDTLFLKDVGHTTSTLWVLDDGWQESARCALITSLVS